MEVRFLSEKTTYQVQITYLKQKIMEYEAVITTCHIDNQKLSDDNGFLH